MVEKYVVVETGLEARPAALFVQLASGFNSKINISIGNRIVNAKSIMGVISLGILDEQEVKIAAEGEDQDQAVKELEAFLKGGFI